MKPKIFNKYNKNQIHNKYKINLEYVPLTPHANNVLT